MRYHYWGITMTNRTGKSQSIRPVSKRPPLWLTYGGDEVEAIIIKLAREGNSPSKIGALLRDQYGIPLTKPVLGEGIRSVLKQADIEIEMPEDLSNLIDKATRIRRHLSKNRSDQDNKNSLEIIESRIRRLSKYYCRKGVLPSDWKYVPKTIL